MLINDIAHKSTSTMIGNYTIKNHKLKQGKI